MTKGSGVRVTGSKQVDRSWGPEQSSSVATSALRDAGAVHRGMLCVLCLDSGVTLHWDRHHHLILPRQEGNWSVFQSREHRMASSV